MKDEQSAVSHVAQTLNAVLLSFGEAIASYRFASYLSCKTFNEAKAKLSGQFSTHTLNMWTEASARDVHSSPPRCIAIGSKGATNEQVLKALADSHNYQNLWILVSAFETYEKFFKDLYGALGFLDQNLWRCEDFGNVKITHLNDKDQAWYNERVRKAKTASNIKNITARLRDNFPSFQTKEAGPDLNLKIWTEIAGVFRHCIVHTQGTILQKKLFEELKNATGCGFDENNKGDRERRAMVQNYYRCEDGICYLQAVNHSDSYEIMTAKMIDLTEHLTSHACLAYSCAMEHFGEQPLWEYPGKPLWM